MTTPREVVLGVDVGTTAVKVAAFAPGLPWRYTSSREYRLQQPAPGRQVQDPQQVATAVVQALHECVAACGQARVLGLSVGTAMHALMALDDAAQPLTPLITWADSRAGDEVRALRDSGQAAWLYQSTGTPVHPMTPQSKLMWFARHEPELCARARWWVGMKEFVLSLLTGQLVTELSSAGGTGLLDQRTRTWSSAVADLSGIGVDRLAPILATTAAIPLDSAVAGRVGLPAGLPVIAGAADGPLANLGTGAITAGVAALSLGTSGAIRARVPAPVTDKAGRLFCYALTDEDWIVGGAISNGGIVARWAGEVFDPGTASDRRTLALAARVPPGSDGLIMVPNLLAERAPLWDPDLPGAFFGIRRHHTRAHFIRAAVEGVCLQLSTVAGQVAAHTPVTGIRATGGVFRDALWRETVAAAVDLPVTFGDDAAGVARGAAALGLYALGAAPSLTAALDLLAPVSDAGEPVRPSAAHVIALAETRASLGTLAEAYRELADLQSSR